MSGQNGVQREPPSLSQLMASKPEVPDYASLLSHVGRMLKQLELRKVYTSAPNMVVMNQGQPSTEPLPLASVTFGLKSGESITLDEAMIRTIGSYGAHNGIPGLQEYILDLQLRTHQPPQMTFKNHPSPFGFTLTCGSLAALKSCLDILVDKSDTVLSEEIVYASFIGMMANHGNKCQSVACDDQGMIPESLDDIITNWERRHPGRALPKVLYVIPYGNNPVGYNWSDERIVQIYLLCRKHKLLIFDDGAYQFIRWGPLNRSFQSVDIDGRVLRFDTFSKTMGAGHRVAWLTGPQAIIEKVVIDSGSSYVHPSHLSQALILSILKTWGHDRYLCEMQTMSEFYRKRGEHFLRAAEKHLKGLALCRVPAGGMFIWVDVQGITDSVPVVEKLHQRGLITVAGTFFRADGGPSSGMRMSISSEPEHRMDQAIEILADVLREYLDKTG